MSRKKQAYQKKPFESTGGSSDTSANIYMSMLLSSAWQDLTANQQRLYLYCKAQYFGEKKKPNDDPLNFTMNRAKWADLYRIYTRGNARSFYKDMGELISHGFVSCIESGKNTRTKSIYRFSSMWQKYQTPAFTISPQEMTYTLKRKRNKEAEKDK